MTGALQANGEVAVHHAIGAAEERQQRRTRRGAGSRILVRQPVLFECDDLPAGPTAGPSWLDLCAALSSSFQRHRNAPAHPKTGN